MPSWLPRGTRRLGALLGLVAVVVYPVLGLWWHPQVAMAVKGAWVVALLAAVWFPQVALLAFLAVAPLLLTLPSLLRWPAVSLPELWLSALLLPALARQVWNPRASRLPSAAWVLGLLATMSLLATIYPLQYGQGSLRELFASLSDFARDDLLTLSSQRHIFSSVLAWIIACEGLALLWLMLVTFGEAQPTSLYRIALATCAGAVSVAVAGLYQRWTGEHLLEFWRIADPYVIRINATFTDVNVLGSYLASLVPLTVALATTDEERPRRVYWGIGIGVLLLATVFTGSRAAWLATLAGLLVWCWSVRWLSTRTLAWLAATALVLLVLGAAIGTLRNVRPVAARSYVDMALSTLNLQLPMEERLKGRPELWRAATRMVTDRPLTGVGIGRYFKEVSTYSSSPDELIRPQENAHNYFLQVAAELGLPGLAVFVALVSLPVAAWRRSMGVARGTPISPWLVAAVAGMAAHALTWLTGHPLLIRDGQMTFWPLVGVALLAAPAEVARQWPWRWPRMVMVAALGIVLLTGRMAADTNVRRVDLSRAPLGVYDTEVDARGKPFKWTKGRASLYVPAGSRTFVLTMRSLAPFSQSVAVMLNGARVDALTFDDHEWRTSRYRLPESPRVARFHRFDLVVTPTWQPPNDNRELGILLGDVSWAP